MAGKCAAGPACFIDMDCEDDEKIEGIGSNETGCVFAVEKQAGKAWAAMTMMDMLHDTGVNLDLFESGAIEHWVDIHETDTISAILSVTQECVKEDTVEGVVRGECDIMEGGG